MIHFANYSWALNHVPKTALWTETVAQHRPDPCLHRSCKEPAIISVHHRGAVQEPGKANIPVNRNNNITYLCDPLNFTSVSMGNNAFVLMQIILLLTLETRKLRLTQVGIAGGSQDWPIKEP